MGTTLAWGTTKILISFLDSVKLWFLKLVCLEHHGSLELIRQSPQFPYILNVKIHLRLKEPWLELTNSKHKPQGNF